MESCLAHLMNNSVMKRATVITAPSSSMTSFVSSSSSSPPSSMALAMSRAAYYESMFSHPSSPHYATAPTFNFNTRPHPYVPNWTSVRAQREKIFDCPLCGTSLEVSKALEHFYEEVNKMESLRKLGRSSFNPDFRSDRDFDDIEVDVLSGQRASDESSKKESRRQTFLKVTDNRRTRLARSHRNCQTGLVHPSSKFFAKGGCAPSSTVSKAPTTTSISSSQSQNSTSLSKSMKAKNRSIFTKSSEECAASE